MYTELPSAVMYALPLSEYFTCNSTHVYLFHYRTAMKEEKQHILQEMYLCKTFKEPNTCVCNHLLGVMTLQKGMEYTEISLVVVAASLAVYQWGVAFALHPTGVNLLSAAHCSVLPAE